MEMYTKTRVHVDQIAKAFGVCKKTVYNILKREKEKAAEAASRSTVETVATDHLHSTSEQVSA